MGFSLTQEEGEWLVKLARKAVEKYLETGSIINVPSDSPSKLKGLHGVFVTVNNVKEQRKKLRGCIGYPYPTTSLAKAVIECAISSATQDPRFPPVSQDEFAQTTFEISVLTPPALVEARNLKTIPSKIEVGKDGLIVERGPHKGLLLPQVAVEQNWDEEEFLTQCCIKAGLPPDAWLMEATKIFKFHCVIASEKLPQGQVQICGYASEDSPVHSE